MYPPQRNTPLTHMPHTSSAPWPPGSCRACKLGRRCCHGVAQHCPPSTRSTRRWPSRPRPRTCQGHTPHTEPPPRSQRRSRPSPAPSRSRFLARRRSGCTHPGPAGVGRAGSRQPHTARPRPAAGGGRAGIPHRPSASHGPCSRHTCSTTSSQPTAPHPERKPSRAALALFRPSRWLSPGRLVHRRRRRRWPAPWCPHLLRAAPRQPRRSRSRNCAGGGSACSSCRPPCPSTHRRPCRQSRSTSSSRSRLAVALPSGTRRCRC
mmetsp:Transcript_50317/g.118402  ORF Transcript_50317/g.118402 Transcript_50317/m.118402 type:complete len:263 (-) Transcript_50317:33-821(-)